MKTHKMDILWFLIVLGAAQAVAGGPNDMTGDYLDQFFAELPPLPSSNPTNSVVWSAPQLITMPDGQSFNVGQSAEDGNPIFESFQISSDNGITNGEFRIYRVPTSIHSYCIVESALSLPRSIPARAFASLFNAEAETNGVYCIVPKSALPGIPGFLLLYENMGIGLFWNGGNQKNLALALLRAGGVDIPDDPLRSSPSSFASESFQATRDSSSDSEEMSPSPPTIPVILGSQSAIAEDPTPGQLFEAAFGVDPSRLGTTNFQTDIRGFQTNCFATNEWFVSFADASERLDNTFVPFSLSNMVSGTVSAGFVEQSESPERAFWTAATRIAANSKPLFVLAEEWTANSDSSGISFLHTTGSSNPPDRLMRLERNLLVSVEASTLDNPSEIVFWIVSYLQNPLSSRADRGIVSGNSLRKPFQSARGISSDSEEESVLPVLESESTADANRFLDHIGIARGSSQSLTNEWALPQSVLVSNVVVSVSGERHFNHFSGTLSDTNATFVGTFEVDVSGSEAGSRTYWGLRQICRPLSPHLYYDFYDIDEIGGGLLLVWNTALNDMGVTNRRPDRVSALYQNICTTVSSDTLAPDVLAIALLRAGGVDIPDDPESPEPSPE